MNSNMASVYCLSSALAYQWRDQGATLASRPMQRKFSNELKKKLKVHCTSVFLVYETPMRVVFACIRF